MKKIILFMACFTILCVSCNRDTKSDNSKSDNSKVSIAFKQLLDDYYEEGLMLFPLIDPSTGYVRSDSRYNNIFPNNLSDEFKAKEKEYYTTYLEKIDRYHDGDLSESAKMSKAILKWECDINLERLTFREDLLPIDQMFSANLVIGQLASGTSYQPFNTVEDYNNWLQRLDEYLIWLASAEDKMKEGIELGYVLPKSLIVKIIPQLKAFTTDDLDKHLFYNPVKNIPESFSESEEKTLRETYAKKITEKIIPAYKSLHQFMSTDYLEAGRETSGIDAIPNGKAYYEYRIKANTSTNMTADEIYQLGLNEVSRIRQEMENVKVEVDYTGDLKSFFDYVRNNTELMPFTEPQQVIDNFNAINDRMQPQLEKLFDLKPKALFEIRRTEAFREKSASIEYYLGSVDGTHPGIFYIPIPDATKYYTLLDEATFLHEAIPGHHYQMSLTQENEDLPQFRKALFTNAYGEGWALYTESLGRELGLYTDPYQYFGMLNTEMHRAIRLVADVGLHAKGWTREQAIQYSLDNEAWSEAVIISEIERYMAFPGQALSYKIGQLKIRELRTRAERELGENFDIRQFHNQVLQTGCVPLGILEDKIDNWIASCK